MEMHYIDWSIVIILMLCLSYVSLKASGLMRGVSDFLSGGRCAGRYLLTISGSMSGVGAITVVAMFEAYGKRGFPPAWWAMMMPFAVVIITLTGWVYYRFRETRCMTMAQYYEVRYSKGFRIYAGIITWLSGIINFGIFPAVASRFFVYFCGLAPKFVLFGMNIPTYVPIMLVTLGLALIYTCIGGQITVMVTDCIQGLFCCIVFVTICFYLICYFSWPEVIEAMKTAPAGESMLNPYHTSKVGDFNFWFYAIGLFGAFYGYMSWQGSQGYYSAALNPHEQKMGAIISIWRGMPQNLMVILLPVCAFAFMNMEQFSSETTQINEILAEIDNPAIVNQMRIPVALTFMLPVGLRGLFCAIMVSFLITTQDTYLHSWGSIFIQDVILPFRKKAFSPKTQIKLLRISIFGVAVFAFLFSLFFKQSEYIFMFFAVTGAIVAGAGAVITLGLYWSRGTTAAAYTAMTLGWVLALGRIFIQQFTAQLEAVEAPGVLIRFLIWTNTINSQYFWLVVMLSCLFSYILVSLLSQKNKFNMKRMLHHGKYAIAGEHIRRENNLPLWMKITGITEEFTHTDRFLAWAMVFWNIGWFLVFVIVTIYNLLINPNVSDDTWGTFWQVWIWMQLLISVPATIWLTLGGIMDIKKLFKRLKSMERNVNDDGRVVQHHLVCDENTSE